MLCGLIMLQVLGFGAIVNSRHNDRVTLLLPLVTDSLLPPNYNRFLQDLKKRIRTAQVKAALAINQEMVMLYWSIGRDILNREEQEGWGAKVVDRLAKDLKAAFPDLTGFSARNMRYMKALAEAYPDEAILQRSVAILPWRHNIVLLEKLKDQEQRLWYAAQASANGWSRDILAMQIDSDLYRRQGGAVTNFDRTLPSPQSDFAQQLLKDPYNFSFLSLEKDAQERDLERALVTHIRDFLLELGVGFSFVGSQYPLEVDGQEFKLDLLFYHFKLRCFVVIDLKMGDFQAEFSGKMNFYVSAVDEILRHPDDQPTIGLILCRSKSRTIAEFSLRGMSQPIGVATHLIGKELPDSLKDVLPTVEQLEAELNNAAITLETQSEE
jgi:predicted nuclease of restriction endonuclease-like (RecB) superfamily